MGPLLTTGPPLPQALFAAGSHLKTGKGQAGGQDGQVSGQGWTAGRTRVHSWVDRVDRWVDRGEQLGRQEWTGGWTAGCTGCCLRPEAPAPSSVSLGSHAYITPISLAGGRNPAASYHRVVSQYAPVGEIPHSLKNKDSDKHQVDLPLRADPLLVSSICRLADRWPREVVVTQRRPHRDLNRQ